MLGLHMTVCEEVVAVEEGVAVVVLGVEGSWRNVGVGIVHASVVAVVVPFACSIDRHFGSWLFAAAALEDAEVVLLAAFLPTTADVTAAVFVPVEQMMRASKGFGLLSLRWGVSAEWRTPNLVTNHFLPMTLIFDARVDEGDWATQIHLICNPFPMKHHLMKVPLILWMEFQPPCQVFDVPDQHHDHLNRVLVSSFRGY
jgi:hypothetical protein